MLENVLPPVAPKNTYLEVATKYCRVVTAIDDEIYTIGKFDNGAEGQMLSRRFDELRQSCEERNMLCHLFQFPKSLSDAEDDPETRKYLERAVGSAKAADIVILDWNLGHETHHGNALEVIKSLVDAKHIGFVMIYTQQENLKAVSVELEAAFKRWEQHLEKLPGEPESPGSVSGEAEGFETGEIEEGQFGFQHQQRLFIFLSVKNISDKAGVKADELIDKIYDALVASIKGRLKWAGLELMTRAREILPAVVASLPEADSALMAQICFQREDEVAAQVADSILDEIHHALVGKPLEVVSDEELFSKLQDRMVEIYGNEELWKNAVKDKVYSDFQAGRSKIESGKSATNKEQEIIAQIGELPEKWRAAKIENLRGETEDDENERSSFLLMSGKEAFSETLAYHLAGSRDEGLILQPFIVWASVRESVLLAQTTALRPGVVLKRKDGRDEGPEWLLCQTGACDCYRPTGNGYLFVAGKSVIERTRSKLSQTQSCVREREIIWDATQLHILEDPTQQYEIVGALRTEFAARIIQRVFNYQGRIGIDTSEWIRSRRGE